jgi:hypothetical protein
MCGDVEEQDELGTALVERFSHAARQMLARNRPASDEVAHAYMDGLFDQVLQRCLEDCARGGQASYEMLAAQPLVLARLAGFLAGCLSPLEEDPTRKLLEALMYGYGEADRMKAGRREHGHDLRHSHDHDHDHDHGHHHH